MEQQILQNNNEEKSPTLKSLEKQINIRFNEQEHKIKALERKIEVLTRAVQNRGNYGK